MTARRAALGLVSVLAVLYGASPWLAARALPPLLTRWGVEASHFSFGYPRWNGVEVTEFELETGQTTISGANARVAYGFALFGGELESVVIDRLTIHLARAAVASDSGTGSLEMPAFWTLVPARRVSVQKLVVSNADPVVSATGSVTLDPDVLQVRMQVESPLLAVPLAVSGAVNPDGRIAITLMEQGSTEPLGALTGVPDADRRAMTFDGRVALTGRPLALAAAYAGLQHASGDVQIQVHARAPWPLPSQGAWTTVRGDGRYQATIESTTAERGYTGARVSGDFTITSGDVKARLDSGGVVQADVPELARIGKGADVDARVSLTSDQDVDIDYAQRNLRIGDGLIATLTVADKPIRVRLRGAFGADRRFELGVVGLDGAPIILASGTPDGGQSVSIKGKLALTGKVLQVVVASMGVTETGGHLVADLEGAIRWPPRPESGLQNVSGKGRVRLALTGRVGEARPFDVALEGDYTLGDAIKLTLDPGAHVVLAADGVELSSVSALALELQPAQSHLNVDSVDFKVALTPISVGKHTLTLNNAWVAIERVTMDGDTIAGSAVIRSHAGRDALPVRLTVSHDLSSATGAFSLGGDWDVKKAVLAAQLPGFNAPYDLDEGTIQLALDGRWDVSKAPVYGANGHVRVNGRRAHYEDYSISGLAVDVPLKIDAKSFAVADTKVSIDAVDVGFPLTNITFGLGVHDGSASIHDLSGSVLGGAFAADAFDYEIATDKSRFTIDLNGISLADVLALEGGDVRGSGILDGRLPVAIDGEAFTVSDGRIVARAPGGTLMYKGAAASSMVAQSGFAFAFQALEDFHYDTLDANVALATDGVLALGVRLQGANPAVEQGRAIQFNLNLTESVPALLESLRAAERVTERVEQRFVR